VNINQIKFLSIYQISDSLQGYHEKRLLNTLLNNYNLLERPVANESEPLEVRFGLTLQQIIDVVSWIALINIKSWNMGLYLLIICTMQLI